MLKNEENRRHCRAELFRMSGLKKYPLTDGGLKSAIDALEHWAVDKSHATRVVDEWMREYSIFPTPAEIRRAASVRRPEAPNPSEGCPLCKGAGSILVTREVNGEPYEFAKRCECRKAVMA